MPAVAAIGAVADVGAVGAEAAVPAVAATTTEAALPAFGAATGEELATAAAVPDLAAPGLEAANTAFGPFNEAAFAANTADVAAGGTAAESAAFGAGATDLTGTAAGVTGGAAGAVPSGTAIDSGFFTGTGGDLFSGVGTGSQANLGASFTGQDIGDVFTGAQGAGPGGAGGGASIFGNVPGTPPGGGVTGGWPDFPGGENVGGQGFGAATDQTSGPIVSQGTGIVDTGPSLVNTIQTPSAVSSGFEGSIAPTDTSAAGFPTTTAQFNAFSPPVNNPLSIDFSAMPNTGPTSFETAFPGATNPATGMIAPQTPLAVENTLAGAQTFVPGADFTGSQLNTMAAAPLSSGGAFSPSGAVPTTSEAFAPAAAEPLPPATNVATVGPPATPANTNPIPAAATPANVPSSPPAVANAPAAAAGGIDPLTGLRMGAAGASIVASGINIANALNQPSYTALQPQYYPGSPFNPQPNAEGFPANNQAGGGLAGGLAANRLSNGLLAGQSPQQLAASGLISPQRATQLQGTYSGITQQYAQQLGVSPQSLSPAVRQMIAARALADSGLGGR